MNKPNLAWMGILTGPFGPTYAPKELKFYQIAPAMDASARLAALVRCLGRGEVKPERLAGRDDRRAAKKVKDDKKKE